MSLDKRLQKIREAVGTFPDWPKKGINFRDIFPLLKNPAVFADVIDLMVEYIQDKYKHVDVVMGLEARGFLFGPLIAQKLNCAFIPLRKKGKLPGECFQVTYSLEYGTDTIEAQKSAIMPGQKVIIVDDLIATGGTMCAACEMVTKMEGVILDCLVLIELVDLHGKDKLSHPFHSFISYEGE